MRATLAAFALSFLISACGGGGAGQSPAALPALAAAPANSGNAAAAGASPAATSSQAPPNVPAGMHSINFAGYTWVVKDSGTGLDGPGPNTWSSDASTVFVDGNGYLHLKVWQDAGVWKCAEVYLLQTLGYGAYRFTLGTDVSRLDPNLVLGLFTYSNAAAQNHRELDIEFSRWGLANGTLNADYTVQAATTPGNADFWTEGAGLGDTEHSLQWLAGQANFSSAVPGYAPYSAFSVANASVPSSLDEVVHINLWLSQGNAPLNGQPLEVVIKGFSFTPG